MIWLGSGSGRGCQSSGRGGWKGICAGKGRSSCIGVGWQRVVEMMNHGVQSGREEWELKIVQYLGGGLGVKVSVKMLQCFGRRGVA
jgi:hypothetical protein